MLFKDCEFNGPAPLIEGTRFEGCTFNITSENDLPAAWQCVDCTVNYEGKTFSFGLSSN